MNPARS